MRHTTTIFTILLLLLSGCASFNPDLSDLSGTSTGTSEGTTSGDATSGSTTSGSTTSGDATSGSTGDPTGATTDGGSTGDIDPLPPDCDGWQPGQAPAGATPINCKVQTGSMIAGTATHLYFTGSSPNCDKCLFELDRESGEAVVLDQGPLNIYRGPVVSGDYVLVGTFVGDTDETVDSILRFEQGVPGSRTELAAAQPQVRAIAANELSVFWYSYGVSDQSRVRKMPVVGGQIITIAASYPQNHNGDGLSVTDDALFWAANNRLWSTNLDGSGLSEVMVPSGSAAALVGTDALANGGVASNVFYITTQDEIRRSPLNSPGSFDAVLTDGDWISIFTQTTATAHYWIGNKAASDLRRFNLGTLAVETVMTGMGSWNKFYVDEAAGHVVVGGGGLGIVRVDLP